MARIGDNSKPGAKGAPDREPFRRAVAGCMRAIAGDRSSRSPMATSGRG